MPPAADKKKRGNPSDFQGKRLEFLVENLPIYTEASKRSKTRSIWSDIFIAYWAKFPWRLPLKQDPDEEDTTDYALGPQNAEEEEEKATLMPLIETKIKAWMGRQGRSASVRKNPWNEWLTRFRTPATPAPKKLADYQFYMQHEDFKGKVTEEVDRRKEGVAAKDLLGLRTHVARELLAAEPESVRARVRKETEAEHGALLEKHEDALEGLPALDEEDKEEARERFSALVGPLLEGLAAHTGYDLSILAGRRKEAGPGGKLDIECVSVHAGVTDKSPAILDFSRADPEAYKDVMQKFGKFVWRAHEYRNSPTTAEGNASETSVPTPVPVAPTPTAIPVPAAPTAVPAAVPAVPAVPVAPALEGLLWMPADFDEFDFPDYIMPGPAASDDVAGLQQPTVDPFGVEFAAALSKDLVLFLEVMPEAARTAKIEELKAMDAEGVMRQNETARNYFMLNTLGLGDAQKETLWGGAVAPPPTKRKAGTQGKAKRGGKRKKEGEGESEAEESGMEIEAEAGAEKEVGASAGSKSKSKPVPKSKASDAWATAANAFLTAADFGEAWTQLVALWWVREKEFGFVGTRQGHSAKKRPKEVGDWVSRARNHTPIVANADDLGVRWWNWWLDINPIWRGTMRPLTRQTGGWASMDYRGQNGFLNVMMSLKWWRDALKEVSPDWEEAVGDVSWVLSEMRRANAATGMVDGIAAGTSAGAAGAEGEGNIQESVGAGTDGARELPIEQVGGEPETGGRRSPQSGGTEREITGNPNEKNAGEARGGAARAVPEGLSQEELDEMELDPDADMEE